MASPDDVPDDPAPAGDDVPDAAPRRRRKKKRRAASLPPDVEDAAASPEPDAPYRTPAETSTEIYRPPFARDYPRDPELERLLAAFLDGNYALVRDEAPRLAGHTDDPEVARAARDLRRRLDPDPLARTMLAGMTFLLAFLVLWFYTHRHGH